MKFCEKLATLRTQKGWRQEDLAARLYVTKQAVSKWETEKSFPEVTLLPKIAELLDTTVNDLLVEKNEQKNYQEKEIIAERSNSLIYIFGFSLSTLCLIILLLTPLFGPRIKPFRFDFRGFLILGAFILGSVSFLYMLIKNIRMPKIVISLIGEKLEINYKSNEIKYIILNQIEDVWAPKYSGAYSGRLTISLDNGENLILQTIKRPSVVKGKIDALKNYLENAK